MEFIKAKLLKKCQRKSGFQFRQIRMKSDLTEHLLRVTSRLEKHPDTKVVQMDKEKGMREKESEC